MKGKDFEVIIVDDDAVVLFLQKTVIEKSELPKPVLICRNGKEALDFIIKNTEQKSRYLILLDINMPVMNGWDFLKEIRKKKFTDQVFVAMVSSSVNAVDLEKSRTFSNVVDFLEKPLQKADCDRLNTKMKLLPV